MSIDIRSIVSPELQQFIITHEHDDERAMVLKHKSIHDVPAAIVAEQIIGRRKAKTKIPTLYKTPGIVYPPGVNLEQCSSEATAFYKANCFKGKSFVDLTGGFGVDAFFFSKNFQDAHYVDPNADLLEVARHNHHQLGNRKIEYHATTAKDFLQITHHHFDLIYIDPSRRAYGNQKVFKLADCEPNTIDLQELIFQKTNTLLIKCAPLLDVQQGLKELRFVEKVCVISIDNECKEVLFLCQQNSAVQEAVIETVNLSANKKTEIFSFTHDEERKINAVFSDPLIYLYEPNASILKAGAFKIIGNKFNLKKIQPSTHLYTSNELVDIFPGRIFKIESHAKPHPNKIKEYFKDGKANITTRNYPLTPEQLKKKTGLHDGGEKYLIGFSGMRDKHLIAATRIK